MPAAAATEPSTSSPPGPSLTDRIAEQEDAYKNGADRPLRSYTAVMATYVTAVGIGAGLLRRQGRIPERFELGDLALVSVATHKLSRLVSKESVTSPLRAGFTRFTGTSGPAELAEEVRGTGARKAVGELVTCPFCLGHWAATGFVFGLALAPRGTRMVASVLTAISAADFLQFAYATAQHKAEAPG